MGLSDDQKALLRLLAQREQGYDDIAALMGLSVEEVRERVKDALAAVEEEGAAPVAPPPEPTPAPPPPDPEPAPAQPVEPPAAPAQPAPVAAKQTTPTKPAKAPGEKPAKSKLPKLPKERRVLAIGGGLAAVILVIVLLATGVIGGSDSSSGSESASDNGSDAASQTVAQLQRELAKSNLTGAILAPPEGGDSKGTIIFGRRGKQVLMNIEATGLETSPPGSSYAVWLYKSPKVALRVGAIKVAEKDKGGIAAQLPIPTQLLNYIAGGVFDQISLTLTSDAAYKAAVRKARQGKEELPAYTGETVLRGPIKGPMVEGKEEE